MQTLPIQFSGTQQLKNRNFQYNIHIRRSISVSMVEFICNTINVQIHGRLKLSLQINITKASISTCMRSVLLASRNKPCCIHKRKDSPSSARFLFSSYFLDLHTSILESPYLSKPKIRVAGQMNGKERSTYFLTLHSK